MGRLPQTTEASTREDCTGASRDVSESPDAVGSGGDLHAALHLLPHDSFEAIGREKDNVVKALGGLKSTLLSPFAGIARTKLGLVSGLAGAKLGLVKSLAAPKIAIASGIIGAKTGLLDRKISA